MSFYKAFAGMVLTLPIYLFASQASAANTLNEMTGIHLKQIKLEQLVSELGKKGIDVRQCLTHNHPATGFEQSVILNTKIRYLERRLKATNKRQRYHHNIVSR